ncbi:MAG: hypothetical protein AB1898_18585 [Acidobacteriota bacterium]
MIRMVKKKRRFSAVKQVKRLSRELVKARPGKVLKSEKASKLDKVVERELRRGEY